MHTINKKYKKYVKHCEPNNIKKKELDYTKKKWLIDAKHAIQLILWWLPQHNHTITNQSDKLG